MCDSTYFPKTLYPSIMDLSVNNDLSDVIHETEYFQNCLENLLNILQSSFHCLQLMLRVLIHGPDGSGKRMLAKAAAKSLSMSFCEERIADLFDENIVGTERKLKTAIAKFEASAPCLIYMTGYELLCKLEEPDMDRVEHCIRETLDELISKSSQPIVFIGATTDFNLVYRTSLSEIFQHHIAVTSPSYAQAENIITAIAKGCQLKSNPKCLLHQCSSGEYYLGNLIDLVARAEVAYQEELSGASEMQLEEVHRVGEGTRWLDVGGLGSVRQEIIDAIQLSFEYPQLRKSGLRRTGILLYGPPGTGKTLLAKAVATECNLSFINVKGPELLNEYVGQSEDNIRKLFQKARESSPAVIFFDEMDSLAPNRGQAGDSGGVMDRMVSQLLAEMDGIGKDSSVFVIAATNRVDLVDPSLLRPGRFDKVLEVPLPESKESRLQILKALTRKMNLADDVNLEEIESRAPSKMSGADFQGLCSRAIHKTFDRCIEQLESGQVCEDEVKIVTSRNDFLQSLED